MNQLFYFYILRLVEKRNPDPKLYGASFVSLAQIIHLSLVFQLLRIYFVRGILFLVTLNLSTNFHGCQYL